MKKETAKKKIIKEKWVSYDENGNPKPLSKIAIAMRKGKSFGTIVDMKAVLK